jgi:hypothetical protein
MACRPGALRIASSAASIAKVPLPHLFKCAYSVVVAELIVLVHANLLTVGTTSLLALKQYWSRMTTHCVLFELIL